MAKWIIICIQVVIIIISGYSFHLNTSRLKVINSMEQGNEDCVSTTQLEQCQYSLEEYETYREKTLINPVTKEDIMLDFEFALDSFMEEGVLYGSGDNFIVHDGELTNNGDGDVFTFTVKKIGESDKNETIKPEQFLR